MRKRFDPQLPLGATPIEQITFNPKSRDDIPQILRGLQHIWINTDLRDSVFDVLESSISNEIDFNAGRPGMDLWVLLVLGCLRVGLNCDYDRLLELTNEHKTVRAMLGHSNWSDDFEYKLQTLKDNVALLTPELLESINVIVVKSGHQLLKKKEEEALKCRCDSFVVEMNVEYPTDIGLLWDAMRRIIVLTSSLSEKHKVPGWRQSQFGLMRLKALYRKAQFSKRSRKETAQQNIEKTHRHYLKKVKHYLDKAVASIDQLDKEIGPTLNPKAFSVMQKELLKIANFQSHALRQIDQIERRVLNHEKILSQEKVYSVFESDVEWISKGKAGVPVELGVKVCVVEDQFQFILHHRVMQAEQDVDVAIPVVQSTLEAFPKMDSCSFDKGFHSPSNQEKLAAMIDTVILPKKGKLSEAEKNKERSPDFKATRRQHSAVESAINGLEQNGLDRCPDKGIDRFKSYVALGVLSRNLQRLGSILTEQERKSLQKSKLKKAA